MSPFVSVLEHYPYHFTGGINNTLYNQEDESDFPCEISEVEKICKIPRPALNVGDIVYWVESDHFNGISYGGYAVKVGIVDEVWKDCYVANYLVPYEELVVTIDGKEHTFKTPTEMEDFVRNMSYRKLPNGYTYSTPLYSWRKIIPLEEDGNDWKTKIYDKVDEVRKAFENGLLVRPKDKVTNSLELREVVEKNGWKLGVQTTFGRNSNHKYLQGDLPLDKAYAYSTFEDADKLAKILKNSKEWSKDVTDSEYSELRILRVLNKAQEKIFGEDALTAEEAKRIYKFMIKQKRFDEIECRWYGGFQWRYYDSKKWYTVNPDTLYDDGTKR